MKRNEPRVSIDPLVKFIEERPYLVAGWDKSHPAARRHLSECQERGWIAFHKADDLCLLMGVHMEEVYGDEYWNTPLPA